MTRIGLKWIEWTINVDRIDPKWIELDQCGPKGPKWTEWDF